MPPSEFAIRVQHGIAGGFAPPMPVAIHTLTRARNKPVAVTSAVRVPPARDLGEAVPKVLSADHPEIAALVDELHLLLKGLPTDRRSNADIYAMDIGIEWESSGFQWRNSAPQGCGGPDESSVRVSEEEKKKFRRAVKIVDELVEQAS